MQPYPVPRFRSKNKKFYAKFQVEEGKPTRGPSMAKCSGRDADGKKAADGEIRAPRECTCSRPHQINTRAFDDGDQHVCRTNAAICSLQATSTSMPREAMQIRLLLLSLGPCTFNVL